MDELIYLYGIMFGAILVLVSICVAVKHFIEGDKKPPSTTSPSTSTKHPTDERRPFYYAIPCFFEKSNGILDRRSKYELAQSHLLRRKNTVRGNETLFPIHVSLNESNRVAKIQFVERKYYRTIERYVQRNYVKTPVYSNWKVKEKFFDEKITLKNEVLERLQSCGNANIVPFALDIVAMIPNSELYPSWALKAFLLEEKNNAIGKVRDAFFSYEKLQAEKISKNEQLLKEQIRIKEKVVRKIQKADPKLNKGIFKKARKHFYQKNQSIASIAEQEIQEYSETIRNQKEELEKQKTDKTQKIDFYTERYDLLISKITPLPPDRINENRFTPLKSILFADYKKIIGCYVIRNTENQKCYVGQSKDVLRRIKQHFHGTVPNNQIFAEDYYTSKITNRDDLFEILIVPASEKADLDQKERALIEEYESYRIGYNRTSGNK